MTYFQCEVLPFESHQGHHTITSAWRVEVLHDQRHRLPRINARIWYSLELLLYTGCCQGNTLTRPVFAIFSELVRPKFLQDYSKEFDFSDLIHIYYQEGMKE